MKKRTGKINVLKMNKLLKFEAKIIKLIKYCADTTKFRNMITGYLD